ncbi:hypothetical protein Tco_1199299 [Tanacetum coccineum]
MITNNSELYLQVQMGNYVEAWTNDLALEISRLFKGGARICSILVETKLLDFIKMITKDDVRLVAVHVYNFTSSVAPEYLLAPLALEFCKLCHRAADMCTDNANISRKRSKPDKHGHGKGMIVQEPGI